MKIKQVKPSTRDKLNQQQTTHQTHYWQTLELAYPNPQSSESLCNALTFDNNNEDNKTVVN